jgi:chaperonin GroES
MNVRPLHDRVLLRRLEEKEVVKGGIIIPDTAKEKPQEAEVIAVGPGKLDDNGKRMPIQEYLIAREDEILGVLEK